MPSLRESASSWEGAGASAFTRERKTFSTSCRMTCLPSTMAQTSGPGAICCLQAVNAHTPSAAITSRLRLKGNSFRKEPASLRPSKGSGGFLYATGSNACSADAHLLAHAADDRAYAAQIGIPATPGDVVRMANRVAVVRLLTTDVTCQCHLR